MEFYIFSGPETPEPETPTKAPEVNENVDTSCTAILNQNAKTCSYMFADSCASCDTRFSIISSMSLWIMTFWWSQNLRLKLRFSITFLIWFSALNESVLNWILFKLNWKRFVLKWESVRRRLTIILVNSRGFRMKSTNYIGSILAFSTHREWYQRKNIIFSTVNVDFEWVNTVTSQVSFY